MVSWVNIHISEHQIILFKICVIIVDQFYLNKAIFWRRKWQPIPVSCLENPMDGQKTTHWKRPWCWERLRQVEKGTTEDEIVGWHHQHNGHEFEQTLGADEGQGSLACYSTWGRTELERTEWLNNSRAILNDCVCGCVCVCVCVVLIVLNAWCPVAFPDPDEINCPSIKTMTGLKT